MISDTKQGCWAVATAWVLLAAASVYADGYYKRYDADDAFPEGEGWWRRFHDPEQQLERELTGGTLLIDSRASGLIFDNYTVADPALEPGPGEILEITWRMRMLDGVTEEDLSDVSLNVTNPMDAYVSLQLGMDFVADPGNQPSVPPQMYPVAPVEWHTYRLVTADMQEYDLFVDEAFAFGGVFHGVSITPGAHVTWGDVTMGALTSLSEWDFVEVRVVPEPGGASGILVAAALGTFVGKRSAG
jgi:hypothetical protein